MPGVPGATASAGVEIDLVIDGVVVVLVDNAVVVFKVEGRGGDCGGGDCGGASCVVVVVV